MPNTRPEKRHTINLNLEEGTTTIIANHTNPQYGFVPGDEVVVRRTAGKDATDGPLYSVRSSTDETKTGSFYGWELEAGEWTHVSDAPLTPDDEGRRVRFSFGSRGGLTLEGYAYHISNTGSVSAGYLCAESDANSSGVLFNTTGGSGTLRGFSKVEVFRPLAPKLVLPTEPGVYVTATQKLLSLQEDRVWRNTANGGRYYEVTILEHPEWFPLRKLETSAV